MLKEFREFAMRGNVVDMAVGIIMGAAFGAIVKSVVDDVIMPPIGLLLGNVDFSDLFITLKQGAAAPGPYATLELAKKAGGEKGEREKSFAYWAPIPTTGSLPFHIRSSNGPWPRSRARAIQWSQG